MTKTVRAGRELDALVAEKVMEWTLHSIPSLVEGQYGCMDGVLYSYVGNGMIAPWSPSADMAAAWQVVEKLGNWHDFDFVLSTPDRTYTTGLKWSAGWFKMNYEGYESRVSADADTAPLAICLAALKAVGVLEE